MEREMCTYLDWELTAVDPILSNFEKAVKEDFQEDRDRRTYPNYPTTFVSKRAARAEASTSNTPFDEKSHHDTTSPVPGFGQNQRNSPSAIKPPGVPGTPIKIPWSADPNTPDTPSSTFSNTTSPTSSGSPATPVDAEPNPKIHDVETSPNFGLTEGAHVTHPLKPKMFAFAVPSGCDSDVLMAQRD